MDGSRFDDLTRRMAMGTSRRQALRLGGGGLATALLTLAGRGEAAADDTPKPLGKKCRKDKQCESGFCDPDTRTCAAAGSGVPGELTEADPVFHSGCALGLHYDAYTFEHSGGPLSLAVRGVDTGGGTLEDPFISLFAGGVGSDFCNNVAWDNDGGCGRDAYLAADLAAGTYTAVVITVGNELGTYTFEGNTFSVGPCPAEAVRPGIVGRRRAVASVHRRRF